MLTRIVRMSFQPPLVEEFLNLFHHTKAAIASQDGCLALNLFVDKEQTNVIYTISIWQSESHLDSYRSSELFVTTWAKTKVLFNDKPKAFSLIEVDVVKSLSP